MQKSICCCCCLCISRFCLEYHREHQKSKRQEKAGSTETERTSPRKPSAGSPGPAQGGEPRNRRVPTIIGNCCIPAVCSQLLCGGTCSPQWYSDGSRSTSLWWRLLKRGKLLLSHRSGFHRIRVVSPQFMVNLTLAHFLRAEFSCSRVNFSMVALFHYIGSPTNVNFFAVPFSHRSGFPCFSWRRCLRAVEFPGFAVNFFVAALSHSSGICTRFSFNFVMATALVHVQLLSDALTLLGQILCESAFCGIVHRVGMRLALQDHGS